MYIIFVDCDEGRGIPPLRLPLHILSSTFALGRSWIDAYNSLQTWSKRNISPKIHPSIASQAVVNCDKTKCWNVFTKPEALQIFPLAWFCEEWPELIVYLWIHTKEMDQHGTPPPVIYAISSVRIFVDCEEGKAIPCRPLPPNIPSSSFVWDTGWIGRTSLGSTIRTEPEHHSTAWIHPNIARPHFCRLQ